MGSILRLTCIIWEEEDLRRTLGVFVGVVHVGGMCGCRGADPVESVGPRSQELSEELLRGSPSSTWGY